MTMPLKQFVDWLKSTSFETTQNSDGGDEYELPGYDDDGREVTYPKAYIYVWKTARANLPDGAPFAVDYQASVDWSGTAGERWEDDYNIQSADECNIDEFTWGEGLPEIVDDDGNHLDSWEIEALVREHLDGITDIDYEALIPAYTTTDIDISEDTDMSKIITVARDNDSDLRFEGELVAEASSSDNDAVGSYSGSVGRWTELRLYRTASGKYVAQSIGRTRWQGEHDRYSAVICETKADVIKFFGHGWLAKALYTEADIEDVVTVD